MTRRRDMLALFLFALLVRIVFAVAARFDGLYGQDPFAYYDYSIRLRAALLSLRPPPPFFWPLGYPLPVALTMLVVGARPLAGQLVSVVAGALVPVFVYGLVGEVADGARAGALAAGLLAAVASQLMISSLSVMSDATGLACAALSAWMMVRYVRTLRLKWLALAALALAWAILTRWIYALAIVPWGVSGLLAWRAGALRFREIAAAASLAVAIGAIIVGSQFVFALDQTGSSHAGDLQVVGWNPAHAFQSTVTNSDGVFHYERPIGVFYALPALHPAFIFPLLTPFLLVGFWSLRRLPRPLATLLAGWPIVVYVFLAGIAWENPRFSLAFFAPLAAVVGVGIDVVWRTNTGRRRRLAIAAWCALALLGSLAWSVRDVRGFVGRKQADLAVAQWAEAQVPHGATMLAFGLTETLRHYTSLAIVELYNETPDSLRPLACGTGPAYLVVDVAGIESQWAGKSPEINLHWLRDGAGLTEIGRNGPYMLYEVGQGCSSLAPSSALPLSPLRNSRTALPSSPPTLLRRPAPKSTKTIAKMMSSSVGPISMSDSSRMTRRACRPPAVASARSLLVVLKPSWLSALLRRRSGSRVA